MPANLTYGVRATRLLESPIRTLDVATGPLVITYPDGDSLTLSGGESHTYEEPIAGLSTYAPNGARVHVTFGDDPVDTEKQRDLPGTAKKRTAKSSSRRASTKKKAPAKKAPAKKAPAKKAPAKKAPAKRSSKSRSAAASAKRKSGGKK